MDIVLIIISGILLLIGLLGSVLPVLPGIPLSYAGILILHFTSKIEFSTTFLIVWLLVVLTIQILDGLFPAWGAKRFGGTKWGVWGSVIGLIAGFSLGPVGIIAGPFVGAVVGEIMYGATMKTAIKAGIGTFIGLIIGTVSKLAVGGMLIFYYIDAIIKAY